MILIIEPFAKSPETAGSVVSRGLWTTRLIAA